MKKVFILALLYLGANTLFAQDMTHKDFIREVEKADLYFYYGTEYDTAAVLYEKLYKAFPENANLAAKLGICYLNIDGKKAESLTFLQMAVKNAAETEDEYSDTGEKAALDSWLYLAIAYHQNDSLKKAIVYYNEAKKRFGGDDPAREEYIDNQIRDCKYATQQMKKPLTIIPTLFTPWLKDYPGACDPVISKNDSVFIFTQKTGSRTRILCSYKDGTWKKPVDITKRLGGFDQFYSNSITGNGKTLILFMDDGEDGNLYYSQRVDTVWSKIKSMGSPINTIYWESHGFITPDGKTLYIATNKKGGYGGSDIWVSERDENGSWKKPVNCGDIINTPYNESTPYFDPETRALLFSSNGHISVGSADVFRSVNKNGTWTTPVGIPYAFNSTADNEFFIQNNKGPGFIASMFDKNSHSRNIYAVVAEDPAIKLTIAQGNITLQDGMNLDPKNVQVLLSDGRKGSKNKNISLFDASSYKFEVKPGDYQLIVMYPGYKTDTINLNVPLYFAGNIIQVSSSLIPDKVASGDFLAIKNILFEYDSHELNQEAKTSLDMLKSLMIQYPTLKIEIAGYTDARGSTQYNKILADNRAQSAIDYLTTSGIQADRLTKKSYGESDFVSPNYNADGSDNPEGRKYNRRVIFGVFDPLTGVVIAQEAYTPEHLRKPSSMKYSIVLLKTAKNIHKDYFKSLKLSDVQFIRTVETDSLTFYILGVFKNRNDAAKYLEYVKNNGFDDAYIINQYQINNDTSKLPDPEIVKVDPGSKKLFLIQLMATHTPADKNRFKGITGLSELRCNDGYYRYVYGDFSTFNEAKGALLPLLNSGFSDAFIIEANSLKSKILN
jgi:outer membrane protein OmpA-like peptidoglycan-associated protein/tetratricopeptide (TPR) repeat protein